jgi:hypothetical protein
VQHPLKLEPGKSAEERSWYNIQIDRLVVCLVLQPVI